MLNIIKNKIFFISFIYLLVLLIMPVQGADGNLNTIFLDEKPRKEKVQSTPPQSFTVKNGILKGNISVTQGLPREFYGTWTVVSTLLETNNPELFRMRSSDIWVFERKNDIITLSNPVSGAAASITVNEVRGKTAVFTRTKRTSDTFETETPQITVQGDSFSGTDLIIIRHFKKGKRIKTDKVKYKVRGYKISGPTLKNIFAR